MTYAVASPAAHETQTPTPASKNHLMEIAATGGYPEAVARSADRRHRWFTSYVRGITTRDAPELAELDSGLLLRVLKRLAADQSGEHIRTRMASDVGVSAASVHRYCELLSVMCLYQEIPAWSRNLVSRTVSRPKGIIVDSGLACHLRGLSAAQLSTPSYAKHVGPLFEGFVAGELLKQQHWTATPFTLFHFRDRRGREVDLVAELHEGGVVAMEVKSTSSLRADHKAGLVYLRDRLDDEFRAGIILYTGQHILPFGDRITAMPIDTLWKHAQPSAAPTQPMG